MDFNNWWEEIAYLQKEMQRFVEHISERRARFAGFGEEAWGTSL